MVGNKVVLNLDAKIQVDDVWICPVTKGESPHPSIDYRGSFPVYYYEIVLSCTEESKIVALIEKAIKEYEEYRMKFESKDDELIVFTYDGAWDDSYRTTKRKGTSIYLPDDNLKKITDDIQSFYDNEAEYKRLEIPYTRTYMFHGLPGTGKTSTIYTIASMLNKNIAIIDFSDNDTTDASIRRALYKLPKDTFLCLEDIDSLFTDRKSDKPTITFSGMLNTLDGVVKNTGLVIFMTTNLLTKLDDVAMKRRVDFYLKFGLMKQSQVFAMVKHFYPKQDPEKLFAKIDKHKLALTPCILQKFFVRHLMCVDICEYFDELEQMCKNEYKIEKNSMMYT
jgi:chaperone BCS1